MRASSAWLLPVLLVPLASGQEMRSTNTVVTSTAFVISGGGSSNTPGTVSYVSMPDLGGTGEQTSTNFRIAPGFIEANDPVIPDLPIVYGTGPVHGSGAGGTTLTISGVNFNFMGSGASLTVDVGGQPASAVVVDSNTQVTCSVPPGALGAATVTVTTSYGSSTSPRKYVYSPAVTLTASAPIGGTLVATNYGEPGDVFLTYYEFFPAGATPAFGRFLKSVPIPLVMRRSVPYPGSGIHVRRIDIPDDPILSGGLLRARTLSAQSLTPLAFVFTNIAEAYIF